VGGDQHLVGAGAPQFVLDRGEGDVRVADLAGDLGVLLAQRGERVVEALARVGELAIDVRGDVVHARAQDRGDDVDLVAGLCALQDLVPELAARERAVGDHEHARARAGPEPPPLARRLAQRTAPVRVLRRDLPHERPGESAGEQRDAGDRVHERAQRQTGADDRAAADRQVEGVGLAADGVAHLVLLPERVALDRRYPGRGEAATPGAWGRARAARGRPRPAVPISRRRGPA
jgi:hypothetical protein